MASKRTGNVCRCPRSSLPLCSTILFLSVILPTSSFAQFTTSLSSTTLPRSTIPSSFLNSLPTQTIPPPPSSSTSNTTSSGNSAGDHAFNYYFLIVAAAAVILGCFILWFGRRKKQKAAMMRSQSQRALARDVEGWRNRFRTGLGSNATREDGLEEGLDERGEAPPPYVPGSKPPSIRVHEERQVDADFVASGAEGVELRRMSREGHNPPGYHEHVLRRVDEDIGDVTRPPTAVTASARFGSMRSLLGNTRSSSQA